MALNGLFSAVTGQDGSGGESRRRLRELEEFVRANSARRLATFETVHVFPDRIVVLPSVLGGVSLIDGGERSPEEPDMRPSAGVRADVHVVAGRARMTVRGADFTWTVSVRRHNRERARRFAAELTAFGRRGAATEPADWSLTTTALRLAC